MKVTRKSKRLPSGQRLAREFASGKWTTMLAEKYGVDESRIESKLMDAVRSLLPNRQPKASAL